MTVASAVALVVLGIAMAATLWVRFRVLRGCPRCSGWGIRLLVEREACWVCGGTGTLRVPDAVPAEWTQAEAGDRRR